LGELITHVPHVERDTDRIGRTARIVAVLDGAAAAGPRTVGLRVAAECQVHARDVVPSLDRAGRSDRGVDAARHGRYEPHRCLTARAARARSCTSGSTVRT